MIALDLRESVSAATHGVALMAAVPAAALLLVILTLGIASAQPTPDQQAETILNAGRKAYNDGNPQFAAERFTELITKFGNSKHAQDARYGLGLALLDLPARDFQKALEAFTPPAGDAKFPEQSRSTTPVSVRWIRNT